MKVKEKMLVEKQVGREMISCPAAIGYRHCEHHGVTIGAHFATRSVSVLEERVVERQATIADILDFWKMYEAGASTMLIQAKYPEFEIRFSKLILQWLTEATDTKADPTLINEPLKASSSSGCPCNRPVLECNC